MSIRTRYSCYKKEDTHHPPIAFHYRIYWRSGHIDMAIQARTQVEARDRLDFYITVMCCGESFVIRRMRPARAKRGIFRYGDHVIKAPRRPVLKKHKRVKHHPKITSRATHNALIRFYVREHYYAQEACEQTLPEPCVYTLEQIQAKLTMVNVTVERYIPVTPWENMEIIVSRRGKYWGTWDVDADTWTYAVE